MGTDDSTYGWNYASYSIYMSVIIIDLFILAVFNFQNKWLLGGFIVLNLFAIFWFIGVSTSGNWAVFSLAISSVLSMLIFGFCLYNDINYTKWIGGLTGALLISTIITSFATDDNLTTNDTLFFSDVSNFMLKEDGNDQIFGDTKGGFINQSGQDLGDFRHDGRLVPDKSEFVKTDGIETNGTIKIYSDNPNNATHGYNTLTITKLSTKPTFKSDDVVLDLNNLTQDAHGLLLVDVGGKFMTIGKNIS